LDKKDKKKKGTLGVGNGAIFFASESDKVKHYNVLPIFPRLTFFLQMPVQQWKTSAVVTVTSDKAKHVDIQVASGSDVNTLRFVAGSREVSDEIIEKVQSSKAIASSSSTPAAAHVPDPIDTEAAKAHKNGASVRFAMSPDSVIPDDEDEDDGAAVDGEPATALYDFHAQASDELSVKEGEVLIVTNREESEEWWKCKNASGKEGVVPSSYVEVSCSVTLFCTTPSESLFCTAQEWCGEYPVSIRATPR
jgi:hypothetical protein